MATNTYKFALHTISFFMLTFLISCETSAHKKNEAPTSSIPPKALQSVIANDSCIRIAKQRSKNESGPNAKGFSRVQLGFVINDGMTCEDDNVFWLELDDLNGQPSRMGNALDLLISKLKHGGVIWDGQDGGVSKNCVINDSHKQIVDITDGTELERRPGYSLVEVRFNSCKKTWNAVIEYGAGPKHDETKLTISKWNMPIELPTR